MGFGGGFGGGCGGDGRFIWIIIIIILLFACMGNECSSSC